MTKNEKFLDHAPYKIKDLTDTSDPVYYSQWIGTLDNGDGIFIYYKSGIITIEILTKSESVKYSYFEEIGDFYNNCISIETIMEHFEEVLQY